MATGFNPFLFLVYTLNELSFWMVFKFLFIIFECFKQVAQPIATHSFLIASVIQKEPTSEVAVWVCWKQGPPPQNQVLEPKNCSVQGREVNVQGAVMSTITSLNNGSMATIARWSHVEWQNLQTLFFTPAHTEASHLKKVYPQRPHRSCLPEQSQVWETATPTHFQVPFCLCCILLPPVKGRKPPTTMEKNPLPFTRQVHCIYKLKLFSYLEQPLWRSGSQ